MPLNLGKRRNGADEDFVSSLKYAAKTNTWSTWDDGLCQLVLAHGYKRRCVFYRRQELGA